MNDHLWTDPSARELMQRKRIYSAGVGGGGNPASRTPDAPESRLDIIGGGDTCSTSGLFYQQQQRMFQSDGSRQGGSGRRTQFSFDSCIGGGVRSPTAATAYSSNQSGLGFALQATSDTISPASLLYHVDSPTASTLDLNYEHINKSTPVVSCRPFMPPVIYVGGAFSFYLWLSVQSIMGRGH